MARVGLGIVSQTPIVRFLKEQHRSTVRLRDMNPNDYSYNTGGVVPMVRAQLNELSKHKLLRNATWFSLNPHAPDSVILKRNIKAVSVHMEHEGMTGYTNFKEKVWNNVHNVAARDFTISEYLGYFRYNSRLARIMLGGYEDIDIFEIHDFQQLLLGAMLGPAFPTIFRWHIPFVPEILSKKIRKFIVNGLEGNDSVIISTKRDLEGLVRAGYKGRAYQIYPHIDPSIWKRPDSSAVDGFSERAGISDDDFIVLNVARMDEIKSQDDLIRAIAAIKDRRVKLLLAGGGSFTSKALGHSKSSVWTHKLKKLAKRLRVEDRVLFTGSLSHEDLECAYSRADLFVLPSRSEGFGLVVVESWLYNTPAIVSDGAGSSELIMDGLNGFTFSAGDFNQLAIEIFKVYKDEQMRSDMGRAAHGMAKVCYISTTLPRILKAYEETMSGF